MKLWTDTNHWDNPGANVIKDVIEGLAVEEFAILGPQDEIFIQTMRLPDGYLLEHREGSAEKHYEAIPKDGRQRFQPVRPWWAFWAKPKPFHLFSAKEIIRAFSEYTAHSRPPEFVDWNKITI